MQLTCGSAILSSFDCPLAPAEKEQDTTYHDKQKCAPGSVAAGLDLFGSWLSYREEVRQNIT